MPKPGGSSFSGIATKAAIGVAVIAAAIYAVSQYIGTRQASGIVMIVLVFLGVLIALAIIFWLGRKLYLSFSNARARRQDAQAGAGRAGVSAQDQSQLNALQMQLDSAIRVIRESKLARGRKTDEALYTLPWILLFGPPESGKTTILRECGVDFPYTTAQERSSKKGKTPTSCDYWFSNGAIVLDPSGRLCAEEEDVETFKGFLQQLKRARRARPVDGVVLAVSLGDIIGQAPEQVEALANRLRQRFDEMMRRLGIRFPVYLVFTKCDQVEGFHDFFGNMRSRDRAQVWGATIGRAERKRASAEQVFQQEYDKLAASLPSYRLQLLASEKDSAKLHAIFTFPSRFASLRDKLAGFVGTLFQPTSYSECPIFRGFYLTGAVGSPDPGARQTEDQKAWDPAARRAAVQEMPASASKNYFLEKLFPRVIFADGPQATASVDTRLRRRSWVDLAFAGTVIVAAILLTCITVSFVNNLALVASTRQAINDVAGSLGSKGTADLQALDVLRQKVKDLDQYETEGHSWWKLGWFMYSGDRINVAARRVYFQRIRDTFVKPLADSLRQRLTSLPSVSAGDSDIENFHNCLNAYLLMTWPARSIQPFPAEQVPFLRKFLEGAWCLYAPPQAKGLALTQLDFYTQQLSRNDPELLLDMDRPLAERAAASIIQADPLSNKYRELIANGNSKFPTYTLKEATGGKISNYLISGYNVQGVFTKDAWDTYFRSAVEQAGKQATSKDSIWESANLRVPSGQLNENYQQELYKRYFSDYVEEWQKFLEGISVRSLNGLPEARDALGFFSQQDSAISRLLANVDSNTLLPIKPDQSKSGSAVNAAPSAPTSPGTTTNAKPTEIINAVAEPFRPLHQLVTSADGGKSSPVSEQYIAILRRIYSRLDGLFGAGTQWDQIKSYASMISHNTASGEFYDGKNLVAQVRVDCTTAATRPIPALLESPLDQTWAALLREIGHHLDGLWRTRLAEDFNREVGNRFPFNPNGPDLPVATLSRFFKPMDGKLWTFYENELKMFLTLGEQNCVPVSLMGARVDFSQQFLDFLIRASVLRQALYPSGGVEPGIAFDLTPEGSEGVDRSLLEIHGQSLDYRNWKAEEMSFTWPGKPGSSGARLTIFPGGVPLDEKGEWALFRLLKKASKMRLPSQNGYEITWALTGADGGTLRAKYELRAHTSPNPFDDSVFKGLTCPDRVTQ